MNIIKEIVQYFFVPLLGAIFFMAFVNTNKYFKKKIVQYFIYATIFTVLLAISDSFQGYYESLSYPTKWRMFFASLSYSLRIYVIFFIFLLFIRDFNKKVKIAFTIPAILNNIVSFMAFFSKKVFYYTENNELIRGPLISIPFIVSIFYFVALIYICVLQAKKRTSSELLLIVLEFTFAFITTLMEAKWRFKGVLSSYSMVGIIFYYLYFLSYNYSLDQLTDAYVRNKLYEDIEGYKKDYGIICMDANNLKIINDTKGHVEGDKCLYTITNQVRSVLPPNAELYRIGGDEFMVIFKTENYDNVIRLVKKMKDSIERTVYSAAIGSTLKKQNESFETAAVRADREMYKDKANYKENNKIIDNERV